MRDLNLVAAARYVVSLDTTLRQFPGDPKRGSSRDRKDRARLNGALSVWEALTGLSQGDALEYAHAIIKSADEWQAATPGLDVWRGFP